MHYDKNPANFATGRAMTEDELHKIAPSIFAMQAHESRSERFAPVPTIEVLRGLAKEGFGVVGAVQSRSRIPGKSDFTKHALRLRKFDAGDAHKVGGTVFEMKLVNANDGTSRYNLLAALYRIVCMNSMVAKLSDIDEVKIMHTGKNVIQDVIEGTYRVVGEAEKALAAPADWSQLQMGRDAQMALAEAAHVLRFADAEGEVKTPIKPDQLLIARRPDDRGADLWSRFNVVQENVIKGGLHGVGRDANNRRRNVTTRTIKGIDQDLRLNKALFVLGERMASILKNAA